MWAIAVAALTTLAYYQESQPPVFRVSVDLVHVDVQVEQSGKPLQGLTAEDFKFFDNGVRRDVELVDVDAVPKNIALVLDASMSVVGEKLDYLKSAAHGFIDRLNEKDNLTLITFSHRIQQHVPLSNDRKALHSAIDSVGGRGATAWRDALYAGLKAVEEASHRPMVVIFTDGADTYSWLRKDQVLPFVRQSDAVVYAVCPKQQGDLAMPPHFGRMNLSKSVREAPDRYFGPVYFENAERQWRSVRRRYFERTGLLKRLTESSGGRLIETDINDELEKVFRNVLLEIEKRYLLTYRLPDGTEEGWHDIKVELEKHKASIRARSGFYYENTSNKPFPQDDN